MALFKIFKGSDSNKLTNSSASGYKTPTDGYAYYDTSTKLFYIDAAYNPSNPNTITRLPINADKAINNDNLTLKFDYGTTEGTNMYTYNGNGSKALNIVAGDDIEIFASAGVVEISAIGGIEVIRL